MDSTVTDTGFRTCDACFETYDYAPDAPPHVCKKSEAYTEGLRAGMAMAAAILVRDFGSLTHALEILGAAGVDAEAVRHLGLDEYDLKPLQAVL